MLIVSLFFSLPLAKSCFEEVCGTLIYGKKSFISCIDHFEGGFFQALAAKFAQIYPKNQPILPPYVSESFQQTS